MSTVNFSVPEEVKRAFNETFRDVNKSAIVAELMMEAVERARRHERSRKAFQRIIKRRKRAPVVSEQEVDATRTADRS